MNNNKIILNDVKNRFLPIPHSTINESNHEPNITDFQIIKELGSGSYGQVYLVYHKITKIKYALKAIDKNDKSNIKEKHYFYREIEIMYKIQHPNVVKLYGHFEDNNFCYFILEYIPNGNIYKLIPKHGRKRLDNKNIASIIKDVISAVYYLHNMNPPIIHRDIKPENILLDENNQAKLTDFGWSNYLNSNHKRNTLCGTPIYLSPEVINQKGHDEKVDIWCIGVLIFELTTGKSPFQGDNITNLKKNILLLNFNCPKDIKYEEKDLISKILKYEPKDRLSLEEILEHNFIKKYYPFAKNDLVRNNDDNNNKEKIYYLNGSFMNLKFYSDCSILKKEKNYLRNNKGNGSNNYSTNDNSYESNYNNKNTKNNIINEQEDFSTLLTKYENLQKDYNIMKIRIKEINQLKQELTEKENKLIQLKKKEYLNNYRNRIQKKENERYKELYNALSKENSELKNKLEYYNNFMKEYDLKITKEKELLKLKDEDKKISEKEREKFDIIINKYDKALYREEAENEVLKIKLEKLQNIIFF